MSPIQYLCLILFLANAGNGLAESLKLESGAKQTHLFELYSSEGCSSCPPADKWMSGLRTSKNLWQSFVPITFHVDYWNNLGWIDPLSQAGFTERQQKYASLWVARGVYTPGYVLDGKEWRRNALNLFSGDTNMNELGAEVGKLTVLQATKSSYNITFVPVEKNRSWEAYGALLGNGLSSQVTSGENRGKILNHEFVVLALKQTPLKKLDEALAGKLTLAFEGKIKPKTYSVAFWVSEIGKMQSRQAVGGDL